MLSENGYMVLEAKNAREALDILKTESVTCAILDIHLGEQEQNGISLGRQISESFSVPFIYLTAYENPEIIGEAVATSPYSYLTKPFKNSDLIASIEIAVRNFQTREQRPPTILVKDDEYRLELLLDKINYIESDRNYLLFHTDDKTYKIRSTIKNILEELPATQFVQTHRAYIVNKSKIEKYTAKSVIITGIEVPVSIDVKLLR